MLRVGLTGGIGSGKSTVAGRLAEHGAVVIDSDRLAREVVAPGTEGLDAVVAEFGPSVLAADGSLDRPKVASLVFSDAEALSRLNAIVHPLVRDASAALVAEAPPEAVVVHDIPLLVENGLEPAFHLVLVVDAPVDVRVERLVGRGVSAEDARARIAAQATDEQRRAAADVWLDNGGWPEEVQAAADALWAERLVPFEANLRLARALRSRPVLVDYDPTWPAQAARLAARLSLACGSLALRVDHIGSTSVPGLPAKDVVDLQVSVRSLADADALREPLTEAGFPCVEGLRFDGPTPSRPDPSGSEKRVHSAADPGRLANVHVRVAGNPWWRAVLLFRDWLRADASARDEYLAVKRRSAEDSVGSETVQGYTDAKAPWFMAAESRAEAWATATGWTPPAV